MLTLLSELTPLGYFSIFVIFFCFFITYKISKRINDSSVISRFFIFIIFFSILCVFLGSFYSVFESVRSYTLGEIFEAKVVNYASYQSSDRDSNGRNRTTTYYISDVEFQNSKGRKVVKELNLRSSKMPIIGETLKISYIEGEITVSSHSFMGYFLVLIGVLFTIVFGFLSTYFIIYAFGYSSRNFKEIIAKAFIIGFKIGLCLFTIGLGYPIYNYFVGKSDMPIWVFVICSFFFLTLLFSLFVVFIGVRKKRVDVQNEIDY